MFTYVYAGEKRLPMPPDCKRHVEAMCRHVIIPVVVVHHIISYSLVNSSLRMMLSPHLPSLSVSPFSHWFREEEKKHCSRCAISIIEHCHLFSSLGRSNNKHSEPFPASPHGTVHT